MTNTPTICEAPLVDPWLELLAELGAQNLPGEDGMERAAREAARSDILDTLLETRAIAHPTLASPITAHPDGIRTGVEETSAAIHDLVNTHAALAAALIEEHDVRARAA
ncbi:hypothetical protein PWG71_25480 [Nocardiopsis sp. N85]|uniref:hypothetical protein n=1 Tax=Nocardiopsis sp. N85 TaxID=3029400 RepID=UPI00237F32DB|nr:hypothetical protein [Nocardiopsis sp. N85]MDE3724752.1 hypothetical protein [Nocardiopsis sp. N85]